MGSSIIGDLPRMNANRLAGDLAVVDGHRRLSWGELDSRVDRLAHVLVDQLALAAGECVAILAHNCLEFVELTFAASRAGILYSGLNTRHHLDEMLLQLTDCAARALIVGSGFEAIAQKIAASTGIQLIFVAPGRGPVYEEMLERASAAPVPSHGDAEAPYALTYTSGTTGKPRGAVISSRNDLAVARSLVVATETQVDDRFLLMLPLFHKGGQFSLLHPVSVGRPVFVLPAPSAEAICRTIEAERISVFVAVPTIMRMLAEHVREAGRHAYDLRSLRHVAYGSSPIHPQQLRDFAGVFGCSLSQIGGGTEGGVALSLSRVDHHRALTDPAFEHVLSSCGRVQPGTELRIVDENGMDVSTGQVGEMLLRGDGYISGYHNQPVASARLWRDGWLHTGDLGYKDAGGFVYYVERLGGRIKTGAETVLAREVEMVLAAHPLIHRVSVVGVPDERWGQAVCAVVQTGKPAPDEHALAGELRALVRARLAGFKVPKHILFEASLPTTALGKVAVGKVKKLAAEAIERKNTVVTS